MLRLRRGLKIKVCFTHDRNKTQIQHTPCHFHRYISESDPHSTRTDSPTLPTILTAVTLADGQLVLQLPLIKFRNSTDAGIVEDLSSYLISHLSRSLVDLWGTTVDFTTSFLHSSRFSAFRSTCCIFHPRPIHPVVLSSRCFLCLPLRLPPEDV